MVAAELLKWLWDSSIQSIESNDSSIWAQADAKRMETEASKQHNQGFFGKLMSGFAADKPRDRMEDMTVSALANLCHPRV